MRPSLPDLLNPYHGIRALRPDLAPLGPAQDHQDEADGEPVPSSSRPGIDPSVLAGILSVARRPMAPLSFYVASRSAKAERSAMWREIRDAGWPIKSSWIDLGGDWTITDWPAFWRQCIAEVLAADALLLFVRPEDFPLRGALVEVGVALGAGRRVFVVAEDFDDWAHFQTALGTWVVGEPVYILLSDGAKRQADPVAWRRGLAALVRAELCLVKAKASVAGASMIDDARSLAFYAHEAQLHGLGRYVEHCGRVVKILVEAGHDSPVLLAAAWLHDVVEDTTVTVPQIRERFGGAVADLVDACTGRGDNRAQRQADILHKLAAHPAAALIKAADRLDNVRASLEPGETRRWAMYQREHAAFRAAVLAACTRAGGLVVKIDALLAGWASAEVQ